MLERQRTVLREIIEVRRAISLKLRSFLAGEPPLERDIVALGRRYGDLDGQLAYEYATAFTAISRTLDARQKDRLQSLRSHRTREDGTAFLYSDRISMPRIPDTAFLFGSN